jgi:hypothetical protein
VDQLAAPESYRARATSSIGYISATTGVVAGGLVFGSQSELPLLVKVAGVCAVGLFVASIGLLAWAAHYTRVDEVDDVAAAARAMILTIRSRTQKGIVAAALAAVAVFVMILGAVLPKEESTVRIILTPAGHTEMTAVCPKVTRIFSASIEKSAIGGNSPMVSVKLAKGSCTADDKSETEISILRTQISLMAKQGD